VTVRADGSEIDQDGFQLELPENAVDEDLPLAVSLLFNENDERTVSILLRKKTALIPKVYKTATKPALCFLIVQRRLQELTLPIVYFQHDVQCCK